MAARAFPAIKARRVLITFHSQGDSDAAGAAIALSRFLGAKAIIAPPDKPSSSARKLFEISGAKTTLFSEIARKKDDFIVVLDSSSPSMLTHLAGIEPDLLIDHHARAGNELPAKRRISDPSASSTCEMLFFLLKPKDKISCIALLCGIISDSADFKNASSQTFTAVSKLIPLSGLSYSQILALSHAPETLGERIESLRSCQSVFAERIGEHIVAVAIAKSHEAHFADMLLSLGADIAFVGCSCEDSHRASHDGAPLSADKEGGRISSRMRESMRGRVRLPEIMAEAARAMDGSSGGHECAAGATGAREGVKEALSVCKKLAEQQIHESEKGKIRKIEW
ncbi:MAG: DHH family phosphoesterase [Candidatus Micrarchaeota archaeon]|nr:DHH family phosphoesterase [Candidatus Micrarchaeota archaeon]